MVDTTVQPAVRHVHRAFGVVKIARVWRALVKGHDDIGAYGALDLHHVLWRKKVPRAIYVALELHALFLNLAVGRERIDLIAAAVSEYIAVPAHELVQPARLLEDLGIWPQIEMIGIAQDDVGIDILLELALVHALYRGHGAHGHQDRGLNRAVVCGDGAGTRGRLRISGQ